MAAVTRPLGFTIRRLQTLEELLMCVRLQEETWGQGFPDLVPTSILLVTEKIGGLVAGAFDALGAMIGFVFGMPGLKEGKPIHWSDMLAVVPMWRGTGVGTALKLYQRAEVMKLGVEKVYWTFDPLVARNGQLNLVRLAADIDAYVPDMYVPGTGDLQRDLGMDRCIAVWRITTPRVAAIAEGRLPPRYVLDPAIPVANTVRDRGGMITPTSGPFPDSPRILIEVPADIHAVRDQSPAEAKQWRMSTRQAFLHYLVRTYRVRSFVRDPSGERCFYLLESDS